MKKSKGDVLLQAVRDTKVGSNIIIHNDDKSIWCILRVISKEHNEMDTDKEWGTNR